MHTSFKVKGKGQDHQADIMLRPEVRHICRTERPTNFKLGVQMEDEDPYRRDGPSPARSKVNIAMSRGVSDRCWPISLERKVPETSKLVNRLQMPRAIMRTSHRRTGEEFAVIRGDLWRQITLKPFSAGAPPWTPSPETSCLVSVPKHAKFAGGLAGLSPQTLTRLHFFPANMCHNLFLSTFLVLLSLGTMTSTYFTISIIRTGNQNED